MRDVPDIPFDRLRQRWISAFARTRPDRLEGLEGDLADDIAFATIRPAETGLVMIRGRAGGSGPQFNTGEMAVSRCSVRGDNGHVGHGYVAGRNLRHAELAARLDARFQSMDATEIEPLVTGLEQDIRIAERARQQKSAPTRVEFFTMVRGDNE